MRHTRITIITTRKPKDENLNEELQWFCDTLGLLGNRDKDKCKIRMFIVLLNAMKNNISLSSDEIASRVNLSRGTVVHHLNSMIDSGVVISQNSKYTIRVDTLSQLVDEIESDLIKTMQKLRKTANLIDDKLGL